MGSRWMRNSFVYLLILVAVIAIVVAFFRPSSGSAAEAGPEHRHRRRQGRRRSRRSWSKATSSRSPRRTSPSTPPARRTAPASTASSTTTASTLLQVPIEIKEPPKFGNWLGLLLPVPADPDLHRPDPLHDAPGAGHQLPGHELRQEPRAHVHRQQAVRHLRRRRRRG